MKKTLDTKEQKVKKIINILDEDYYIKEATKNDKKNLLIALHVFIFYVIGVITALTYVWGWLKDLYGWIF